MDDRFVDAYRRDTGEKVRIPRDWLDHPRLGKPFNKTPRQKAADTTKADTSATTKAPASGDKKE